MVHGRIRCLFCCCCCLLTKVLGLRAKLLITPGSKIFRQTSLGLQKGLPVYQKSEKVYWVNNQHEQTKSMQSQVKDLLLQSIYTRTFYLLSHAFRQFPKTVTTLIVYIYTDINRSHLMKFHKKKLLIHWYFVFVVPGYFVCPIILRPRS